MRRGESPDSGADTSARSEESWQSSRKTASSESTGTLSNAQTARNANPHVLCKFQSWTWIGKSSTTQSASFAWRALMHAPQEHSRQSSPSAASFQSQVRFPLEPGVGVEPTSAIHSWMLTTGCYEMFLQPVA